MVLAMAIEETQPKTQVRKLIDLCRSRWALRIDALSLFEVHHPSATACLQSMLTTLQSVV